MRVEVAKAAGWSLALLVVVAGVVVEAADLRLVDAVKQRAPQQTVQALLKEKIDVNMAQPDGATALHWAIHWDDRDTAELLIRAGADVNAANVYGVTPLWIACTNGSVALVERLLTAKANPAAALPTGETALMTCARTGKVETVRALLARGVDVNAKESWRGQTALMWAAAEGHAEVARVLIEHGADIRARARGYEASRGDARAEHGEPGKGQGFTPLLFAVRKGDLATTRVLLSAGADVNEATPDGTTPLVVATIRGKTALAEFLLERGANPNLGPGFTPLHWAAGYYVTELSDNTSGILAEDTDWSYLGGLRGEARVAFVKVLLKYGANVNARAQTNPNPYVGGISPGGRGNVGSTPFLLAAAANDVAVMRVLLAAGADPQIATTNNTTPLMVASGIGYTQGRNKTTEITALETAKLILEFGAEVNAVNANGETALHGAAYREKGAQLVQFLVDKGANLNVKSKRGWTPLVITEGVFSAAFITRDLESAALLRKLGAEPSPPDVIRDQPTIDRLLQERARAKP